MFENSCSGCGAKYKVGGGGSRRLRSERHLATGSRGRSELLARASGIARVEALGGGQNRVAPGRARGKTGGKMAVALRGEV